MRKVVQAGCRVGDAGYVLMYSSVVALVSDWQARRASTQMVGKVPPKDQAGINSRVYESLADLFSPHHFTVQYGSAQDDPRTTSIPPAGEPNAFLIDILGGVNQ